MSPAETHLIEDISRPLPILWISIILNSTDIDSALLAVMSVTGRQSCKASGWLAVVSNRRSAFHACFDDLLRRSLVLAFMRAAGVIFP